jgi:PHP family Zn ribbon phosphoesterase
MTTESEINNDQGVIDIVNKINDSDRASAIDAIQDLLYAKASDAMSAYKQVVAKTFFDEPTETETTDETDNGND